MCVALSSNPKPAGRGGAPAAQSEESSAAAALEDHDQRALVIGSRRIRWPLWGHDRGHDQARPEASPSSVLTIQYFPRGTRASRSAASSATSPTTSFEHFYLSIGRPPDEASFARGVAASLKREGIAVVRNVIPAELVGIAREEAIGEQENLLNRLDVQQDARVLRVLEHENLAKLIREALLLLHQDEQPVPAGRVETTTFKWLRCVKEKLYTGLHQDLFYLGNDNYLTAWIPFLDNTDLKHGALTWLADDDDRTSTSTSSTSASSSPSLATSSTTASTNTSPTSECECDPEEENKKVTTASPAVVSSAGTTTTSSCSNNGTTAGWLDLDASKFAVPAGKVWRSTSFQAGDVAIFDMRLLHMTVPNLSGINRISCDTRWRLASCDQSEGVGQSEGVDGGGQSEGVSQEGADGGLRAAKRRKIEGTIEEQQRKELRPLYYDAEQAAQIKEPRLQWKVLACCE